MILCRKCGHQNADDESFCAQCNTYLEWSGDHVASSGPAAPAAPAPTVAPAPPAPVPVAKPAPIATPSPTSTPSVASPPPPAPNVRPPVAQPAPRPPSAAAPPARKPTAAAPQPASRQPTAAPAAAARPRTQQPARAEEPTFKPGDRICSTCGMGNDPARKFCRRCGSSLELAVVAVAAKRPPWYRRLFRKSQVTMQAGARPQSMADPRTTVSGLLGRVLPFAVVIIIMGAIGSYFVVPDVQLQVNRTVAQLKRQFMPDLASVTPVATGRAFDAIDNNKLTWWQSGSNKPSLTLDFDPAVDLANIIVSSGAAEDDYAALRRPLALDLVVDGTVRGSLTLTDSRDPQSLGIDLRDVSELRLVVTKSTGPDGQPVAIRELEFKAIR